MLFTPAFFIGMTFVVFGREWYHNHTKTDASTTTTTNKTTLIAINAFLVALLVASVTEVVSVFGTHWKSFTPLQYCVEKNTLSGALLNPVFMRIILPNVMELTLSISC